MKRPNLNRLLTLETATRTPDGAGGFNQTWTAVGALWAEVRAGTGDERARDFVTVSTVPYRITVRAAAEGAVSRPKPEQRFREGTRIFRILAVSDADFGRAYLTCFTREEVVA